MAINQRTLEAYKSLNPDDSYLQALTLDELLQNVSSRHVDYSKIAFSGTTIGTSTNNSQSVATGLFAFDCLALFLGAGHLRSSVTEEAATALAEATKDLTQNFSRYAQTIKSSDSSRSEIAAAVFGVVSTIYSGGCLSNVLKAFVSNDDYYLRVLIGATALGDIMTAVSEDGAAEIGVIQVELATAGWLIEDSLALFN